MKIQGKYNNADVKTSNIENECIKQLHNLCNQEIFKDSIIKVMPDCHAGKGCVVGFTASIKDKIVPNLVGVDISCSISTYKLDCKTIDFQKLDNVIKDKVPSGMNVKKDICDNLEPRLIEDVKQVSQDIKAKSYDYFLKSIGTLGGGNHFIEINKDKDNNYWLTVHCGSRNFGKCICEYHQNKAIETCKANIDNELKYLEGKDLELYKKHMQVAQKYAIENHRVIVEEIIENMDWKVEDIIFTNHNYIEFLDNKEMIIRKGAISAKENERVIIPINMRDGSIIGVGKGNQDWNYSAPHGAGRILSRTKAKKNLELEEYIDTMKDVWSSCVCNNTLDECPMAYKNINDIINNINDTVEIMDIIKPVYNFKNV